MSSSAPSLLPTPEAFAQLLGSRYRRQSLQRIGQSRQQQTVTLRDLKITDESGRLIPFVLNPVQRALMTQFGLDPDDPAPDIAGKLYRERILKARREGVSTLLYALLFLDTYNHSHRRMLSVSNDATNT